MAPNRIQMKMIMTTVLLLSHVVLEVDSSCSAQTCSSYASGCSTNANCVCFQLINGTGMCAGQTSTSGFRGCTSNLTCTDNSTICVVNSCFGQPLCYPLSYAGSDTCPVSSVTPIPANTPAPTPYRPPDNQGNGGLDIDLAIGGTVALGAGTIGGIVAVVVVVVVVVIVLIMLCLSFRPGC